MCLCERERESECCSYISVQFVAELKLKFYFQVVNCLPLCPLADTELKFKLSWPCTAALCTNQSASTFLSPHLSLTHCFALPSHPLCPIIVSSLLLSILVICSSLLSTSLLFPSSFYPVPRSPPNSSPSFPSDILCFQSTIPLSLLFVFSL